MNGIHVGKDVVCIDDTVNYEGQILKLPDIDLNKVYRVSWIGHFNDPIWQYWFQSDGPMLGVYLEGMPRFHPFGIYRFKPVVYTNIDIFLNMLKFPPKKVKSYEPIQGR